MAKDQWSRLPGKSRNYIDNATGQILSRRQYDNLAAPERNAPIKPISFQRLQTEKRKRARYQAVIRDLQSEQRKRGVDSSARELRNSDLTKHLIAELGARNKNGKPAVRRIKAALIALGRREGIPYAIAPGDSGKNYRRGNDGKWFAV